MPTFKPLEEKVAKAAMTNPKSTALDYVGVLSIGEKLAEVGFHLEAGQTKEVSFPTMMPSAEGQYAVYLIISSGGTIIKQYRATEDVVIVGVPVNRAVTFTVRLADIPSYAAGAYQWFIAYGGQNWGMIDPQEGVWTPIGDIIEVTGPSVGTLTATLHAGPFESWTFTAGRTFISNKEYVYQLAAGILGSGVALTDLVVEPDWLRLGASTVISVTAVNTESSDQQHVVVFTIDANEIGRETVSLGPLETKAVSVEHTPTQVGMHIIRVEALAAVLEVKESYPSIPQPVVKSIEWTKIDYVYGYTFKGTMLLPGLEEGEVQGITAWLVPKGNMAGWLGSATPTYLSNGLWSFTGGVGFPRFSPHQLCLSHYRTLWTAKCPACSYWQWTAPDEVYPPQDGLAIVKQKFIEHIQRRCSFGDQPHCVLTVDNALITSVQEPQYYLTAWPCKGTKLTLMFNVAIYAPTGGDPPYSLVREWEINTGLTYVVQ